jgi:CRISPR-associated endonuclease Cas2
MRKGELAKKVVLTISMGLAIGAVMVIPPLALTFKEILKSIEERKEKITPRQVKRVLLNLQKRKLVSLKETNGDLLATFNEAGKKLILKYKFEELKIETPARWDGEWRIVIFDVPEKKKLGRNVLREKLRSLGFYQLQKSVFIHPFECQREIEVICRVYEVEPYVYFIRANYIDNEGKIKKKFNLV